MMNNEQLVAKDLNYVWHPFTPLMAPSFEGTTLTMKSAVSRIKSLVI